MKNYCKGGVWQSGSLKSLYRKLSSNEGRLPLKVVFHRRSFSVKDSIKGRLPSKISFHQRSSSIEACLPSQAMFQQRLSFIKGCVPSKVPFHRRSSSIEGHFTSFIWRLYRWGLQPLPRGLRPLHPQSLNLT